MEALNIGFISPGPATWPHYDSFMRLIPDWLRFDFQGLGLYGQSLYEITGKKDEIIGRIAALATEKRWQAAVVIGAPTEVMNPGLFGDLRSALKIPITTALSASVTALRCYKAKRLLLLTPFEDRLNQMILDYLRAAEFDVSAPRPFANLGEAGGQTPQAVYDLAKNALEQNPLVDAIYFQGAVLDPLKVLDRIERDMKTTAIASNPAMLWDILSQLGRRHVISGYGKLLADWPGRA